MSPGPVLVYAGKGSSHSWTWLADLFDARGVSGAEFVDARGLVDRLSEGASLVVVSGGDGFEMASSLAPRGFGALGDHVRGGGSYVGVCAGAYLPLPSRVPPFDRFNLSTTRIRNVADGPVDDCEASPRRSIRYGSCRIVHPVRGPVVVTDGEVSFEAPLYGGPVFSQPDSDEVLLRYSSFTPKTSFQVEPAEASDMMLGAPAVVSCRVGQGVMILAGPHLEHPGHPRANEVFTRLAGLASRPEPAAPALTRRRPNGSLDRSLADLKVAVLGMERESFLVGAKLWDGGRVLELVDAIEKRKASLDDDVSEQAGSLLDRAREEILSLGARGISEPDSAPSLVVEAARICVDRHFSARRG